MGLDLLIGFILSIGDASYMKVTTPWDDPPTEKLDVVLVRQIGKSLDRFAGIFEKGIESQLMSSDGRELPDRPKVGGGQTITELIDPQYIEEGN